MKKDGKDERGQGRVAPPVSRRESSKAWRVLPRAEHRTFGAVPATEWLWLGVSGGTFRRGMPLKQQTRTAERIRHMKPPKPDLKGLCKNQDCKDMFLAYRPFLFLESLSAVPMYNRGVVPGHALPHRGLPFVQPRRAVLAPSGGWAFFRRQTCGSPYRETPATVRCVFGRHGSGRGP